MTTPMTDLADSARLWIYGADRPLTAEEANRLEGALSAFVAEWAAHGSRLRASSRVLERRFVVVAADEELTRASGCSIDELVRFLSESGRRLGCSLLDGSLIYYRNGTGDVESVDREAFRELGASGDIGPTTTVFDLTLARLGELRAGRFERPLAESWHRRLVPEVRETV